MPAFSRAIEKGYGIELDVQVTKDNRIVVFHDYSLGRMCGIDIPLETKTYAELQELCLQNTRETIPLLSDVLKSGKWSGSTFSRNQITFFPYIPLRSRGSAITRISWKLLHRIL